MAYDLPTVEEFLERFPAFAGEDEYLIAALIGEAAEQVDTTWREVDYPRAIMYFVAHTLVTDDTAGATTDSASGGGAGGIASESFGGISVSYSKNAAQSAATALGTLQSSLYGQKFLELQQKNFPAIAVIRC